MKNRLGEIGFNKFGSKMTIVEYNGSRDIIVEFERGNRVHTSYDRFNVGSVKNVYDRTVCGVGYLGDGDFVATVNRVHTEEYSSWKGMIHRCYADKKYATYEDCEVSEEWHNFQNFAKWYNDNFYQVDGQRIHLDKDILNKGNKIYSPQTCVFVPQKINQFFVKRDSKRGNLPIGVGLNKSNGKYIARCRNLDNKLIHIGIYESVEGAFKAYKEYKEGFIRELAENLKSSIPNVLYNALVNYKVEVND